MTNSAGLQWREELWLAADEKERENRYKWTKMKGEEEEGGRDGEGEDG